MSRYKFKIMLNVQYAYGISRYEFHFYSYFGIIILLISVLIENNQMHFYTSDM